LGEVQAITLSVVTPLYNEGNELSQWWRTRTRSWANRSVEIIPIDDASVDDTAARLASLVQPGTGIRPVSLSTHEGYSESVRRGIGAAVGQYVVIAEFGALKEIETFEPLLTPLRARSALISVLTRAQPKNLSARLLNWLTRLMFGLRFGIWVSDIVPACWAIRRPFAEQLARELPKVDFFFGAAKISSGQIAEIPIESVRRT
jgi:hypothetical protein